MASNAVPAGTRRGRERLCSTPRTAARSRARSERSASTRRRHRGLRSRALALLAIIGPGLIVMVGDNDAGGVATYSQAGQNYGTSLLWVLLLLIPVLIVNQEMVVRLGAVTGVGHARLIIERFGRFWGWFEVGYLFLHELPDHRHRVHRRAASRSATSASREYVPSRSPRWALVAITASGSFRSGSARCSCSCSPTCS